jgi:hypothetical protein
MNDSHHSHHCGPLSLCALVLLLLICPRLEAQQIHNHDKMLAGTDKILFLQPHPWESWTITAASIMLDRELKGVTLYAWLEDPPFEPIRDPETNELRGCQRCLTLIRSKRTFINLSAMLPLKLEYPTRLGIAATPEHGALPEPVLLLVRLRY